MDSLDSFLREVLVVGGGPSPPPFFTGPPPPALLAMARERLSGCVAVVVDEEALAAACARVGVVYPLRFHVATYAGGAGGPADSLLTDLVAVARRRDWPVRVHAVKAFLPVLLWYDELLAGAAATATSGAVAKPAMEVAAYAVRATQPTSSFAFQLADSCDCLDGLGINVSRRQPPPPPGSSQETVLSSFVWLFVCASWRRFPEKEATLFPVAAGGWLGAFCLWAHVAAPGTRSQPTLL